MTTLEQERVVCRACGHESEHTFVVRSSAPGPLDLDTRPSEPLRATLRYWVQRCPSCGYCAPSLAEGPAVAARVCKTAAYRAVLDEPGRPALANRFLCSSVVLEHGGAFGDAGWQAVYAAWACDDASDATAAAECRARAVELFDQARASDQSFAEEREAEGAVVTDLLRRAGRFDAARERCETALAEASTDVIRRVLAFERARIEARDAAGYTVDAAGGERGAAN